MQQNTKTNSLYVFPQREDARFRKRSDAIVLPDDMKITWQLQTHSAVYFPDKEILICNSPPSFDSRPPLSATTTSATTTERTCRLRSSSAPKRSPRATWWTTWSNQTPYCTSPVKNLTTVWVTQTQIPHGCLKTKWSDLITASACNFRWWLSTSPMWETASVPWMNTLLK